MNIYIYALTLDEIVGMGEFGILVELSALIAAVKQTPFIIAFFSSVEQYLANELVYLPVY